MIFSQKKATKLKKGSQISMFRTIWQTSFQNMPIAEKKTSNPSGKNQVRDVQMSNALGVDISFCWSNAQLTGLDEELTKNTSMKPTKNNKLIQKNRLQTSSV